MENADEDSSLGSTDDVDLGHGATTKLHRLIQERKWKDVLHHLRSDDGSKEATQTETDGTRPLHTACSNDPPLNVILALLDTDPEGLAAADEDGRLPLHVACGSRSPPSEEVISVLLSSHPDGASTADSEGQIPLTLACVEEAPMWLLRTLLAVHPEGARSVDEDGNLPLFWAFRSGSSAVEVVELLLSAYPDAVTHRNAQGSLPLHRACTLDAPAAVVQILLDAFREGASAVERDGNLPIHLVCRKCGSPFREDAKGVPSYLDLPDDLNVILQSNSKTCKEELKNTLEVLKLLLGIYPDGASVRNRYGELPLHRATSEEAPVEVVNELLAAYPIAAATRCSDVIDGILNEGIQNSVGSLPLHLACSYGSPVDVVQALLSAYPQGASELDGLRRLPLHCAIRNNAHSEIIKALIDSYPDGARASEQNSHGLGSDAKDGAIEIGRKEVLPIHMACILGASLNVVDALLSAFPEGARIADENGDMPVHLACRYNASLEVVRFLNRTNPEMANLPDHEGRTPLDFCKEHEQESQKDALPLDRIDEDDEEL